MPPFGAWRRNGLTVSYLVSSYNKSEYLISVLESVESELKQTGGDVLIIDDGSTDGSWAAIEAFSRRDARITVQRQENRGIFNVTNQLIRSGTEKWMRIVDCDDPPILGRPLIWSKSPRGKTGTTFSGRRYPTVRNLLLQRDFFYSRRCRTKLK